MGMSKVSLIKLTAVFERKNDFFSCPWEHKTCHMIKNFIIKNNFAVQSLEPFSLATWQDFIDRQVSFGETFFFLTRRSRLVKKKKSANYVVQYAKKIVDILTFQANWTNPGENCWDSF